MKFLLKLCRTLQFDDVAEECVLALERVIDIITVENWTSVRNYIRDAGLASLNPKMETWIKSNIMEIIEERNIKSLHKSQVTSVCLSYLYVKD